MREPFQSGKIPIVFVHGLASDPQTWSQLESDLVANPSICSAATRSGSSATTLASHSSLVQLYSAATWPRSAERTTRCGAIPTCRKWSWSATAWAAFSPSCKSPPAATRCGRPPPPARSTRSSPTRPPAPTSPTRSTSNHRPTSRAWCSSPRPTAARASPCASSAASAPHSSKTRHNGAPATNNSSATTRARSAGNQRRHPHQRRPAGTRQPDPRSHHAHLLPSRRPPAHDPRRLGVADHPRTIRRHRAGRQRPPLRLGNRARRQRPPHRNPAPPRNHPRTHRHPHPPRCQHGLRLRSSNRR